MFVGDGAKMVRDAFKLAKEKQPTIIFIDELDAVGTKRFDSEVSGDREVQRTMLNQLDAWLHLERQHQGDRGHACFAARAAHAPPVNSSVVGVASRADSDVRCVRRHPPGWRGGEALMEAL